MEYWESVVQFVCNENSFNLLIICMLTLSWYTFNFRYQQPTWYVGTNGFLCSIFVDLLVVTKLFILTFHFFPETEGSNQIWIAEYHVSFLKSPCPFIWKHINYSRGIQSTTKSAWISEERRHRTKNQQSKHEG